VPKEEVERLGHAWGVKPVGNGPYVIDDWNESGRTGHFTRFDGYFFPPLPYVDEIEYQWGLNASVQLLKMQRGEVDVLYSGFTGNQLARVEASDQLRPFLFQQPLFASRWLNLHPRVAAFKDKRVREALNWATDRDQLGRITGAEATAWGAPYPESMNEEARTFEPYGYDLEKAKSLLAEAGASNLGFTLWITDSPEPELGQVLQQQWKAAGVNVTLKQTSVDTVYDLSLKGECDAWFSTYYAIYPTPIDLVSQYYETGGAANYTHYSNPKVDRLTAQARGTVDAAKRAELLAQVEQTIGDDAVHVFLETVNWLMGVNQERIKNYHYSGVYGPYYDRLWVES
jgi:peptide/nickel transport system substrate-binding protein